MMKQESKKVWLYCRSATDVGNALSSQLNSLMAYSEQKRYNIVGTSQEIGSGLTLSRPELNKIKNFKKNTINALLVKDVARISRNLEKYLEFAVMMKEKGIEIIFMDEKTVDESKLAEVVDLMLHYIIEDNKKRDKKAREHRKMRKDNLCPN